MSIDDGLCRLIGVSMALKFKTVSKNQLRIAAEDGERWATVTKYSAPSGRLFWVMTGHYLAKYDAREAHVRTFPTLKEAKDAALGWVTPLRSNGKTRATKASRREMLHHHLQDVEHADRRGQGEVARYLYREAAEYLPRRRNHHLHKGQTATGTVKVVSSFGTRGKRDLYLVEGQKLKPARSNPGAKKFYYIVVEKQLAAGPFHTAKRAHEWYQNDYFAGRYPLYVLKRSLLDSAKSYTVKSTGLRHNPAGTIKLSKAKRKAHARMAASRLASSDWTDRPAQRIVSAASRIPVHRMAKDQYLDRAFWEGEIEDRINPGELKGREQLRRSARAIYKGMQAQGAPSGRDTLGRAFAVATAQLQKHGYLIPGTATPTRKGYAAAAKKRKSRGAASKRRSYEGILAKARFRRKNSRSRR